MKVSAVFPRRLFIVVLCASELFGCATDWQDKGIFLQTTQTRLSVETEPSARVFVNNKFLGNSPLRTNLEYGREIRRKTRKVTYWRTQPGLSLFITLISLGIYLPFSLIPVDTESSLEPTGRFQNNQFDIAIDSEGYESIKEKVLCTGQDKLLFKKQLIRPSKFYP